MDKLEHLKPNLIKRIEIQADCLKYDKFKAIVIELCRRDPVFFFKWFLWTYDPRTDTKDLPFVPYEPYQTEFIRDINQSIASGESALTEKSRDMGVTWMVLGVFLYRWLFFHENFLLGSKVESAVDTIGDMDSHFERLRYMLRKLPSWMLQACGLPLDWETKNSGYMKMYKDVGASIVGESMNKSFSRQGRYKAILLDEFAFVDFATNIWRACGDSAPCKLPVSTPNGGGTNFFYRLRKGLEGKIKVITLDWRKHPTKDDAWYQDQKENRSSKDLAQEIDINYTVSAGEPFYNGFRRAIHVKEMNISLDKELVLCFDYGFQHPNCSIHQLSAEGIWIIVDNIFGEAKLVEEFGYVVQDYMQQNYPNHRWGDKCYGDPAGRQSSDKTRKSSEQILQEIGFKVRSTPSNQRLTNYNARKKIIERRLRTLLTEGIPALVVNDTPGNQIIIEAFEGGYRYPNANKDGGIVEHPLQDNYYEHPMNTVEYFAVNMFRPSESQEIKNTRRFPRPKVEHVLNGGFSFAEKTS